MLDSLRHWILWQASLTAFLVVILGVLKTHANSAFFSYWMKAWALFGVWLGVSWLALGRELSPWPVKWPLLFVSLSLSYLEICLLFLGAFSLHPGRVLTARVRWGWTAGLLGFAGLIFLAAFALREHAAASFALRSAPRSAALAVVYLYAAGAIHRSACFAGSRGAGLTVWGCAAYGLTKIGEALEALAVGVLGSVSASFNLFFLLDAACELAVVAGMVLLLFEESRGIQQRLELYQAIVPTCSGCGAVRDDAGTQHGRGRWMSLQDFLQRHSAAQFSHGFCPRCLKLQLAAALEARSRRTA